MKNGPFQLGLLCYFLALYLLPVAELACLDYLLQYSHLDLFVSLELFPDGGIDMPQASS